MLQLIGLHQATNFLPPLTATEYPVRKAGERLVEALIDILESRALIGDVHEVWDVDLIVRASVLALTYKA